MAEIDYYFTLISPWTYLGHRAFLDLAAGHGAAVRYRPIMLREVFEHSGATPLAQRAQARKDYRFVELQRWREKRGLPLNLRPQYFPADPALADRAVIAIVEAGGDPGDFTEAMFRACWVEDRDIADREVIAATLRSAGHEAETVLAGAESDPVQAVYARNTEEAVRLNAIGSPNYVLNGEVFWGQDRLDLLADALQSRRAPYVVPG